MSYKLSLEKPAGPQLPDAARNAYIIILQNNNSTKNSSNNFYKSKYSSKGKHIFNRSQTNRYRNSHLYYDNQDH